MDKSAKSPPQKEEMRFDSVSDLTIMSMVLCRFEPYSVHY